MSVRLDCRGGVFAWFLWHGQRQKQQEQREPSSTADTMLSFGNPVFVDNADAGGGNDLDSVAMDVVKPNGGGQGEGGQGEEDVED